MMTINAFVEQIEKLLSDEGITRNQQRSNKHHFVLLHRFKHFKGPYNKVNLTCEVQAHGPKWPVVKGEDPQNVWVFFHAHYTGRHNRGRVPLINEARHFPVSALDNNALWEFKKMLVCATSLLQSVMEKEKEDA